MIELKTIKVEVPEVKIISGKCDWCRGGFDKEDLKMNYQPYGEVEIKFGYPSEHDDEKWIGEICDKCFDKYLKPKLRLSKNL